MGALLNLCSGLFPPVIVWLDERGNPNLPEKQFLFENSFPAAYCMLLLYADIAHVKNTFYADVFLAYKLFLSA